MEKIQTPLQVIDKAKCQANIQGMIQKAASSKAVLRPHFKTHQSLEVGSWFREAGVDRIAVSSVSMAEFFARDGWKDIMIAFPVNLREIDQINQLARMLRLGLLVSCPGVIEMLGKLLDSPADIYFKVDVGTHRTGFDPASYSAINRELEELGRYPMMQFRGFVAHAGHTYQAASREQIISDYYNGTQLLTDLREHFSKEHPGIIISWGDTPSCSVMPSFRGIDEIRPGNFVFYDLMQRNLGVCTLEEIAMVVSAPVVALHPERNEVVVYAGAVHLSKEQLRLPEGKTIYGMMVYMDDNGTWKIPAEEVFMVRMSQEHGVLRIPENSMLQLQIGQLLGIIPVHSCLAADLLWQKVIV